MKSKIDSFSKGVGLSPARIAGLFLMLGLMGYFVYSIAVNDRQEDSDQEVVISEDKAQKIELTADQKLEELSRINNSPGENFLLTIERMAEAERLLVEVESGIEPTKVQSELIDEIRIRNKSVTVAAMMSNKISCDAEKVDLLNFCMSRIDSEVPAMRESCRFWLCSVPALDFAFDPSDAKLQGFLNAMRKYPDGYLSSPDKASVLGGLVVSMHSQGPVKREFAKKSYIPIAEQFAKSELPQVRSLSEKLKEHSIFGDFGLPTLEHRILWSDPTAESDLAGAFDALSQVGYVKPETWLTLIRAYERFLAVDKIEEAGEAWQKMWSYSEKLKGIKGVDGIQKVLNRQRTRAMFFGKPFDVAGNSVPNNEPIDATHQEYYAIIFLDRGRSSLEFLIRLGKVTRDKQMKFLPILAFEKELSKADFDSLSSVPKDITIADHETSQKYFRAFPADFFPYVLLVNRKGEVVSVNVDVEQVDTRIAKFELDKKRQRLESIGDPNPTSAGSR